MFTHIRLKTGEKVRVERYATERHVGILIEIKEKGKRLESFEPWQMKEFHSKYKPLRGRQQKESEL